MMSPSKSPGSSSGAFQAGAPDAAQHTDSKRAADVILVLLIVRCVFGVREDTHAQII
jgi:hypothetical protein